MLFKFLNSCPYNLSLHRVGGLARSGLSSRPAGPTLSVNRAYPLWMSGIFDWKFGTNPTNIYSSVLICVICAFKTLWPLPSSGGGLWRQHIFDGIFGRSNVYYYLCTVKDKLPIMWGKFFPNIENRWQSGGHAAYLGHAVQKQDGGNFFKNRVNILDMKKELQLGETLLETF